MRTHRDATLVRIQAVNDTIAIDDDRPSPMCAHEMDHRCDDALNEIESNINDYASITNLVSDNPL